MNIDVKKKKEKRHYVTRWVIYYGIMTMLYVLMSTIHTSLPSPLIILSFAVCISAFEDPFDAAIEGCIAGLLIDSAEGTLIGLNGIILMWCCMMSSLLFYFVLRKHILNGVLLVVASTLVQAGFRYLFYFSIWGYDPEGKIFVNEFLPVIIITILSAFLIFPFVKKIRMSFGEIRESYIEEKSDDIVRE